MVPVDFGRIPNVRGQSIGNNTKDISFGTDNPCLNDCSSVNQTHDGQIDHTAVSSTGARSPEKRASGVSQLGIGVGSVIRIGDRPSIGAVNPSRPFAQDRKVRVSVTVGIHIGSSFGTFESNFGMPNPEQITVHQLKLECEAAVEG